MYAIGQIVNGYLAERLNPKKMVAAGLFFSVVFNCAMGFARGYVVILVLWGLNGYSLSMIWTPVFKILTNWFSSDVYRRISVWISLPTTVGYLISWNFIRLVASKTSWPFAFYIPAACGAIFLIIWMLFLKPTRESAGLPGLAGEEVNNDEAESNVRNRSLYRVLIMFGLIYIAFLAVTQGMIKESINLWGPTLISELAGDGETYLAALFSTGIPVAGTIGILMTGQLLKRREGAGHITLITLFGLACACAGAAFAFKPAPIFIALLLSALTACICGANAVITVFLPTGFVRYGISAQVSGILNFAVYMGAGLGGSVSGLISDRYSWNGMYLLWSLLAMIACFTVQIWHHRLRNAPYRHKNNRLGCGWRRLVSVLSKQKTLEVFIKKILLIKYHCPVKK
jgi:OPA family glycerol-3-phosphate transporter-like MFS transporter